MKCVFCNKVEMLCEKKQHHYKESGLDNVYLEGVEIFSCPSCNEELVSIPTVPELHTLIGKHLIEKKSLLNGKEIRFLQKNAGLSVRRFSKKMGVNSSTMSRWENGEQKLTSSDDRLVRLIYSGVKNIPIQHLVNDSFEDIDSTIQELIPFNISLREWCKSDICLK
jgi:putative transcriptional regulator